MPIDIGGTERPVVAHAGAEQDSPRLAGWQNAVPMAPTMLMAARARNLRAAGHDIISLSLGEPEFPLPPEAAEAACLAAREGRPGYPALMGESALRRAIARKRDGSGDTWTEDHVIIGNGARQVIFDALTATLNPGDQVIVPAPYWNAYPLISAMAGAEPVFVDCPAEEGFLPRPDDLAGAITSRSKWLILNFPSNPSGAVCSVDRLAAIAHIVRRHPHLWIMSDEIYEHLIFDASRNPSLADVAPDLRDRILIVSGFSKTFAMTGWRIGYGIGPRRLIDGMAKIQGQTTGGVASVTQAAALGALKASDGHIGMMRDAYARRTARVAETMSTIPGVTCHKPGAAFYVFPGIAGLLPAVTPSGFSVTEDWQFCERLLEEGGVGIVPGAAFGRPFYVRISCAANDHDLDEACRRFKMFCLSLTR